MCVTQEPFLFFTIGPDGLSWRSQKSGNIAFVSILYSIQNFYLLRKYEQIEKTDAARPVCFRAEKCYLENQMGTLVVFINHKPVWFLIKVKV